MTAAAAAAAIAAAVVVSVKNLATFKYP